MPAYDFLTLIFARCVDPYVQPVNEFGNLFRNLPNCTECVQKALACVSCYSKWMLQASR